MKLSKKFKEGDRVIVSIPKGETGSQGGYVGGETGVVLKYISSSDSIVVVNFDKNYEGYSFPRTNYFVREEELEHDIVYNSPLYKTLK